MSGQRAKRTAAEADHASKKPRFDKRNPSKLAADESEDDEEELYLEADEIGRGGLKSKRNAVKLDGYDSESSNENFDQRADRKAKASKKAEDEAKSKDEEDDDMFADLDEKNADGDDDEDLAREGKKRKEVRFMDEEDIEGQVMNSKSGGHVSSNFKVDSKDDEESSSSDDESVDDEERAALDPDMNEELGAGSKKHRAPKVDAFNMKDEAEEGKFDESGNFVRNAVDPHAMHDTWLEGTSKASMKRAREAHLTRQKESRAKEQSDDAVSTADLLVPIIKHLQMGETILEALARLGPSKIKKKYNNKQKNRRNGTGEMDVDVDPALVKAEKYRKEAVEEITEGANRLMNRGQADIYDEERELLMRQYARETGTEYREEPLADEDGHEWEFRWTNGGNENEVHGPYDSAMIKAWVQHGYFDQGAEFRRKGTAAWSEEVPELD